MDLAPQILGIIGAIGIGFILMLACIAGIYRWLKPRQDSFDDLTDWPGVATGQHETHGVSAPGVSGGGFPGAVPSGGFDPLSHGDLGINTCSRQ